MYVNICLNRTHHTNAVYYLKYMLEMLIAFAYCVCFLVIETRPDIIKTNEEFVYKISLKSTLMCINFIYYFIFAFNAGRLILGWNKFYWAQLS